MEKEWLIYKDEQQLGPFTNLQIIYSLQAGVFSKLDLIKSKSTNWIPIGATKEFSKDALEELFHSSSPLNARVFYKRKFDRIETKIDIDIHNQGTIYSGQTISLSAGGLKAEVQTPNLNPNDIVIVSLYLGGKEKARPINVKGEVASKIYRNNEESTFQEYIIRFSDVEKTLESALDSIVRSKISNRKFLDK